MTEPVGDLLAMIVKRNGAWFIEMCGQYANDMPPNETFDCASALPTAKRIAKDFFRELGATHLRWDQPREHAWYLYGDEPEWEV